MGDYDRLSAQDFSFLLGETHTQPMHVAAVQVFERGGLATEGGGIDFESIKKAVASLLHRIPRYRQKLLWTPLRDRAVWVDDPDFQLDYHIRHTALPRPGRYPELKRLAARIMELQLDRRRPLWEMWVAEGLEEDRFAVITKIHHCMIDGFAGVDLAQILFSPSPEYTLSEAPEHLPRPTPSGLELVRDDLLRRAGLPWRILRGAVELGRRAEDLGAEIGSRARAVGEVVGWLLQPASETPINGQLGPHRRFDWLRMPLADVKAVRRVAGCTVNDVVLATASGALREYLIGRGADPRRLDFRVSAPVSVRRAEDQGRFGNRVSSWIIRLPLGETSPLARLEAVRRVTGDLKESRQAMGVETIMQVAEWTPPVLLSLGAQAVAGPINSIITNVPGPQFPLYLLGARLLDTFPMVPLLANMGLAAALFSYDGNLFWGFNADYDRVPDLERIPGLVQRAFQELAEALEVESAGADAP